MKAMLLVANVLNAKSTIIKCNVLVQLGQLVILMLAAFPTASNVHLWPAQVETDSTVSSSVTKTAMFVKLENFAPMVSVLEAVMEIKIVAVESLASVVLVSKAVSVLETVPMASTVSKVSVPMDAFWIQTVLQAIHVLMVNVKIHAKVLLTVEIMLSVKLPITDPSVFALRAMIEPQVVKAVSRLAVQLTQTVPATNGATEANVKIPVPMQILVVAMLNVVSYITKLYALVLLDLLETLEWNVLEILTSVKPIHVVLMPDVLTSLVHLTANVSQDAKAIPRLVALAHPLKSMDATSRSVVPMPSAGHKMELESAIALMNILMEIQAKVAHLSLEVSSFKFSWALGFCKM